MAFQSNGGIQDPQTTAPAAVLADEQRDQLASISKSTLATHDCKRHGTANLLAALNALDGKVIGRRAKQHQRSPRECTWPTQNGCLETQIRLITTPAGHQVLRELREIPFDA